MRKFALLLCLIISQVVSAQKDAELEKRLNEFMVINDSMDLNKVMDYTYPKLFSIVPREKLVEAMQAAFDNEEMTIKLDSFKINTIFPVFKLENGLYAKVMYSMIMLMAFKEDKKDSLSAEDKKERDDFMISHMESEYGKGNASIDPATGFLKVKVTSPMVAIKDSYAKQWSFVNLEENEMTGRLFSKAVLAKLATYK